MEATNYYTYEELLKAIEISKLIDKYEDDDIDQSSYYEAKLNEFEEKILNRLVSNYNFTKQQAWNYMVCVFNIEVIYFCVLETGDKRSADRIAKGNGLTAKYMLHADNEYRLRLVIAY
jgi:hypothetical protein